MLNWQAIGILAMALCLPAHADRGKDAYNQGVRAKKAAKYDEAFEYFKQAYTLTPNNPKYIAAYTRMRFSASSQHIHAGQLLRNTGNLTDAMNEFQRAVEIDSTSFMAQQELRRTADMIRRQEQQKSEPKVESPLAKLANPRALAKLAGEVGEGVELKPLSNAPISLRLTANADVAYRTICKLAGINVFIDPDYRPQKLTLELTNVTLNEALEIVRLQSKTVWRAVTPQTIFVYSALAFAMSAGAVELDPTVAAKLSTETITLRGTMKADVVYNVICERADIDVIFDPSFEPRQMWLMFNDVTLREALELVRRNTRTVWHAVAPHTIAVVPVPPPKIEYR